jgi:hypothetical protein
MYKRATQEAMSSESIAGIKKDFILFFIAYRQRLNIFFTDIKKITEKIRVVK